ncbi:MAG: hypothetical protein K0S81_2688 [Rhodospirillales bacterium]|nr:hypothetical protein [Rhodospirillales bacterium]
MLRNIRYGTATSSIRLLVLAATVLMGAPAPAAADKLHRSNSVPNVGELTSGEQPLGDLWTFRCPRGGSVTVAVDTKDDTDDGGSAIDPVLVVFDGQGNVIAFGDDEDECSYRPLCGFRCPSVRADCGLRGRHSIVVRDFGVADRPEPACQEGGGYELSVEVLDAARQPLSEQKVKLGGGPRKIASLPAWLRDARSAPARPALDDEAVPKAFESDKMTCVIVGPGSGTCGASAEAGR